MTSRIYKYEVETTKKGNRSYKKYKFTFLVEFNYDSSLEWIEKVSLYMRNNSAIHFAEKEKDGNFYVYIRHKKYKLGKEVTMV